eukprot:CAMPEP_0167762746 /NCGR_PEP_ID=MMETSP0110_2-20121227/12955_1 /TAXON_ID=629695 /ORGANISM="Gymnochlora sp., Strain CCMP2014" /LENGTH=191 /DNA_ID=CAMNT_0007649687 /DNA_START=99 /DNA_END=674 /DNA_ORIENTATION=-
MAEQGADVSALLSEGIQTTSKNPKAALQSFQKVIQLSGDEVSIKERQAAFWNTACIFLKFGDIDKAQRSLENAIRLGLDIEEARYGSDPKFLPLQGSSQKMEEELWRYAKQLTSAGVKEAPLRPELQEVADKLDLDEGQDMRIISIARRVAITTFATFALIAGIAAVLFPGLRSPEPEAEEYVYIDSEETS